MGKNDPMKGKAGDYAKKAQQKRGVQDPLSDIDMDDEMLQDPTNPKDPRGTQRSGRPSDERRQQQPSRGQESMDEPAAERWDI